MSGKPLDLSMGSSEPPTMHALDANASTAYDASTTQDTLSPPPLVSILADSSARLV